MEVDSDSSSGSVIITGPIPEYPELRKRPVRRSSAIRNGHQNKRKEPLVDLTQDEKVEKIQELENLVHATNNLPRSCDNKDDDVDAWSGSDTKSVKGYGKRDPASKYLKKIKTLQQNKRRQETRISRLTKEVRSLRDKVGVQAAYIDVLCGLLGDDMKEKFRDRQGMGILGNTKTDEDNMDDGMTVERGENGTWAQDDAGLDKTPSADVALKEKEREFYCVEDLDEVDENGMDPGSSEDMKEVAEVKGETMENDIMAEPLDVAGTSTSFGIIGNRKVVKEARMNAFSPLTIAVGKRDPVQMMCDAFPQCDGDSMGGNNGQVEIHHGVFGATFEKHLSEFSAQVGESVPTQESTDTSKDPNQYGEMRVQVAYVEPQRKPMPPVISYGMVMGNHGLNLLPAVHPTTDDPLNIGSDDTSSFGPLIINTSLDPLNLIAHPTTTDRTKISQATPTLQDPLNIGSDEGFTDDSRDLLDHVDPTAPDDSTALLISLPSSSDVQPNTATGNDLSGMPPKPMETESTSTPLVSPNLNNLTTNSTATGNVQLKSIPMPSATSNTCSPRPKKQEARADLSMPEIPDTDVLISVQQQDDSVNISHPQEIVDHLINNMSCDLSPNLRLE